MCLILFISEHDYTPVGASAMAEKLKVSQSVISELQTKNNRLSRKGTYLRKKVKSLQEAVDKYRDLMSAETFAQATEQASSIPADLLKRYNSKQETPEKNPKFEENIRKFALGLHLKSARAYRMVRKALGNALPSEKTIQRWCMKVDASPGFNGTAFR
jgi:hypothetical protein